MSTRTRATKQSQPSQTESTVNSTNSAALVPPANITNEPSVSPVVPLSNSTTSKKSPEPATEEWPKSIYFPASDLDAFSLDAWSQLCQQHGYRLIHTLDSTTLKQALKKERFICIVPTRFELTQLEQLVQTLTSFDSAKSEKRVYFVSSVVFTSSELGAFPSSLASYRQVLKGVYICPTSLTQAMKKTVTYLTSSLGGILDAAYRSSVTTHLVAAKAMSEKYHAVVKRGRPIVSEKWVHACFREGQLQPTDPYRVPYLEGAIISAVGLTTDEEETMKNLVVKHGGQYLPYSSPPPATLTHIISGYPIPDGVESSLPRDCVIVRSDWLDSIINRPGHHADVKQYRPLPPSELATFRAEVAAERAKEEKEAAAAEALRIQKLEAEAQREAARIKAEEEKEALRIQAEEEEKAAVAAAAAAEAARKEAEVLYDPQNDEYLSSLQIFLLGLDDQAQIEQMCKIIRFGGGTRLPNLYGRENLLHTQANSNCSNLVLVYGSCKREILDEKLRTELHSRTKGCDSVTFPIVNYRWLIECYKQKKVVPFSGFELPPPTIEPTNSTTTTTTVNNVANVNTKTTSAPRAPSPALITRTASVIRPSANQRAMSTTKSFVSNLTTGGAAVPADGLENDVTLDMTNSAAASATNVEGHATFAHFNQTLNMSKPTASLARPLTVPSAAAAPAAPTLPPIAPITTNPPVSNRAGVIIPPKVVSFFAGLRFVIEDEDPELKEDEERKESDKNELLPALRFTSAHRLTVIKAVTDYGGFITESDRLKSADKNQNDYVIGGVCGSVRKTTTEFKRAYGANSKFASYLWIDACTKATRLLDIPELTDYASNPCWGGHVPRLYTHSPPIPGFKALMITCTGFNSDDATIIGACITAAGASFTPNLTRRHTHLIYGENTKDTSKSAESDSSKKETKKDFALRFEIPIVQATWLLDCIKQRQYLEEADYLIRTPANANTSKTDSKRRSSRGVSATPITVPTTPMLIPPETPKLPPPAATEGIVSPISVAAASAPIATLPSTHFDPPPSTSKRSRSSRSKAIKEDTNDGTIDDAVDEDDEDDFGFGRGLLAAQTHITKQSPSAPPSAKELFQQKLKDTANNKSKGKKHTMVVDEEDENEGEAEAYVDLETTATTTATVPTKVDAQDVKEEEESKEVILEPSTTPVPAFQSRRTRGGSAASTPSKPPSSEAAASLSLASGSKVIPLVLLSSPTPSKKFKKKLQSKADDTPPATPQPNKSTTTVEAPVAEETKEELEPGASLTTPEPINKKRGRRRITLSDSQEDPVDTTTAVTAAMDDSAAIPEVNSTPSKSTPAKPTASQKKGRGGRSKRGAIESIEEEEGKNQDETTPAAATTVAADPKEPEPTTSAVVEPEPEPKPTRSSRKKSTTKSTSVEQSAPPVVDETKVVETKEVEKAPSEAKSDLTKKAKGMGAKSTQPTLDEPIEVKPITLTQVEDEPGESELHPPTTSPHQPTQGKTTSPTKTPRATRTSRLSTKPSPPLRSPSLGGFPDTSAHDAPKRGKRPLPVINRTIEISSQNEDPFEFDPVKIDAESKASKQSLKPAQTTLTETQVLSDLPHETSSQDPESVPSTAVTTTPAGRTNKRKAAASTKKKKTKDDDELTQEEPPEIDEQPIEAEVQPETPKPKSAKKSAAAKKKRKVDVPEAADEPATIAAPVSASPQAIVELIVTEHSITPPPTPAPTPAATVPATATITPTPEPPARRGNKRKLAQSNQPSEPSPPPTLSKTASPLKRTNSLADAAASLSDLRAASTTVSTVAVEEAEVIKAEEEEQPKKKSKTKSSTSKKLKDQSTPSTTSSAMEIEEPEPTSSTTSTPVQKKERKRKTPTESSQPDESAEVKPKKGAKSKSSDTPAAASVAAASSSRRRLFTLTGVHGAQKPDYIKIIESLGGELIPDDQLDYHTLTHVICLAEDGLKRSEKVLVSLVGQQYLLHPSYLDACKKANAFVDEKPFEWINHSASKNEPMLPAIKRWYHGREKPYASWCVGTLGFTVPQKVHVFKNLLEFGGGEFVDPKDSRLTHLLIDTPAMNEQELKKESPDVHRTLKQILTANPNIFVLRQDYLTTYLVKAGQCDSKAYQLTDHAPVSPSDRKDESAATTTTKRKRK